MIEIIAPKLRKGQQDIVDLIRDTPNSMFYTINTPRGFGKSFLLVQLMLNYAVNDPGSKGMFCTLTYGQASKIYNEIVNGLQGSGIIKKKNSAENSIIFINDSELYFKSISKPDNLLGYHLEYLFLDEAAMYREDIFQKTLRPFLRVKGKKCFIFSTPKRKNWFYEMFMMANKDENYQNFQGSNDWLYVDDEWNRNNAETVRRIIKDTEDARKNHPQNWFRQEYLSEFLDDGGEVFSNVNINSTINKWEEPRQDEIYFAGIDIGRANDFTVLTIFNRAGNIVFMDRINKIEYTLICSRIGSILKKYNPRYTLVEINGVGDPFFSMLKKEYSNITPFQTTNQSKNDIIEELIMAFQDNQIKIPTKTFNKDLHEEIEDFTFEHSRKTGKTTYGARTGHDDIIMSLAMANYARKTGITKGQYVIL